MCGVVGVINKLGNGFNREQLDVFTDLLWVDTLRGEDSTGIFMVENNGDVHIAKEASEAPTYLKHKEVTDLLNKAFRSGSAIVGHNRKATKGDIKDENAHPFIAGHHVLVHNGTLFGDHKKHADTEVDSHAIAHVLSESPDDIQGAIQKISGAFALSWFNMEKQELYLLRNSHRPLHIMETHNAFIFASEAGFLQMVKDRHKLTTTKDIVLIPEAFLCTFSLKSKQWTSTADKIELYDYTTYSRVQNPLANAWGNCDDGPNYSACDLPQDNVRELTVVNESKPRVHVSKAQPLLDRKRDVEEHFCKEMFIDLDYQTWISKMRSLPDGTSVNCIPIEYKPVDEKHATSGSWLLCAATEDSDLIISKFFPSSWNEQTLQELVGTTQTIDITINGNLWRPWNRNKYPDKKSGFGVLIGGTMTIVPAEVE